MVPLPSLLTEPTTAPVPSRVPPVSCALPVTLPKLPMLSAPDVVAAPLTARVAVLVVELPDRLMMPVLLSPLRRLILLLGLPAPRRNPLGLNRLLSKHAAAIGE